jgi:predicted 2-oxoglutarate/Fe(II)-dependent dioxygenase YbiX
LNPMLRFLKYGDGEYFKPHCDGLYGDKENQTKSFLTVHLYLNDGNGLEGGATRFWTPDKKEWLDVEPKMGRILVFQQRMLVHSGERVTGGIKVTMRTDVMFERVVVTREERKARAAEKQGAMQDA